MDTPVFKINDLGDDSFELEVEKFGKFRIEVREKGSGSYFFRIGQLTANGDYSFESEQSCNGHPVLERQGDDAPPAAVISIVRGYKSQNIVWPVYWRHGQRSY